MSTQITTAHVKQFSSNVFHLSQQKGSRLADKVRNESQRGKTAFYDRIGATVAVKKLSRHSDTPQLDTPHTRRAVHLVDYEVADLIDNEDKIRMLMNPQNEYSISFMWALGRAKDDAILDAASDTASTGEDGSGSQALGDAQKVAAVNSGATAQSKMNVEALRRAKKLFDQADVDESIERYCAINALQLESMLGETEVTSHDFNSVRALVMGELDTFLGFKFIRTQQINNQSGALQMEDATGLVGTAQSSNDEDIDGSNKVLCWAKDGLLLATAQEVRGRIDERADKSYSTQVYASLGIGAVRMEEEKVVEILCVES